MNLNHFMNSRIIMIFIRTNKLTKQLPHISLHVLNCYNNCIGDQIVTIINDIKFSIKPRISFNYNPIQQYKDNL
jgi:hypothetical protein